MTNMMRTYLIGPEDYDAEYPEVVRELDPLGYEVITPAYDNLRLALRELLTCDAVCLFDGWWSSRDALCLQTVAGWLAYPFIDTHGELVPTASLRG